MNEAQIKEQFYLAGLSANYQTPLGKIDDILMTALTVLKKMGCQYADEIKSAALKIYDERLATVDLPFISEENEAAFDAKVREYLDDALDFAFSMVCKGE